MSGKSRDKDRDILSPDTTQQLLQRARALLTRFRQGSSLPPLQIEMLGTPASGKTGGQQAIRHLCRGAGYNVGAPREGAEAIEGPRPLPLYNIATYMYAMLEAFKRFHSRDFDIVLFDRALWDGVVRMELYLEEGVISAESHATVERFMRLSDLAGMFDLHVFMVCKPETTLARKANDEVIRIPGKTLNPDTLQRLYDAHERVWNRFRLGDDPRFLWVDTDEMSKREVGALIVTSALDALERKLAGESG